LQARPEGHAVTIDDEGAMQLMSEFNITKNVDRNLLNESIFKVLDRLPSKYRDILILKFLEEKNYQEISDIIKKPVGTVGSMMNKAKKEFKKELEKQKIKI
jgi:RNA polymerase sigma-70 factor (ECF subfamily)